MSEIAAWGSCDALPTMLCRAADASPSPDAQRKPEHSGRVCGLRMGAKCGLSIEAACCGRMAEQWLWQGT